MSDELVNGKKFKLYIVLDDYNGELLAINEYTSLTSLRVQNVLSKVICECSKLSVKRVDNGTEFISHTLKQWCSKYNNIQH